jgi:hypothetical protein
MSNTKSSAVSEDPVDVLIVLHDKFDLLDFAAVAEVLTTALHNKDDACELAMAFSLTHAPKECLADGFPVPQHS